MGENSETPIEALSELAQDAWSGAMDLGIDGKRAGEEVRRLASIVRAGLADSRPGERVQIDPPDSGLAPIVLDEVTPAEHPDSNPVLAQRILATDVTRGLDLAEAAARTHPVDFIERFAEHHGMQLDPARVAEMRAVCDAPVGWSSTPPTESGFYWWRGNNGQTDVVRVDNISGAPCACFYESDSRSAPADMGGDWWSEPIAEPPQ